MKKGAVSKKNWDGSLYLFCNEKAVQVLMRAVLSLSFC